MLHQKRTTKTHTHTHTRTRTHKQPCKRSFDWVLHGWFSTKLATADHSPLSGGCRSCFTSSVSLEKFRASCSKLFSNFTCSPSVTCLAHFQLRHRNPDQFTFDGFCLGIECILDSRVDHNNPAFDEWRRRCQGTSCWPNPDDFQGGGWVSHVEALDNYNWANKMDMVTKC